MENEAESLRSQLERMANIAEDRLIEIGNNQAQIEWLKQRIADLQLPPKQHNYEAREKFLIECGMPAKS